MMTMVSPEYIEKAERKTSEIKVFIEAARLYGATDEDLLEKLVVKFDITPAYAQNCLDAEWDDDDII